MKLNFCLNINEMSFIKKWWLFSNQTQYAYIFNVGEDLHLYYDFIMTYTFSLVKQFMIIATQKDR